MKRNFFCLTLFALVLAMLAGCGQPAGQPAAQPDSGDESPAGEQTLVDTLISLLEEAGYDPAEPVETSGSPMYGEADSVYLDLNAGGADTSALTIYRFTTPEKAETTSKAFDPEDPSSFQLDNGNGTSTGMVVDYVAPITLYLQEDSIILYCGEDEAVRELLTQALGQPFAGTLSPVSAEAIPHAGDDALDGQLLDQLAQAGYTPSRTDYDGAESDLLFSNALSCAELELKPEEDGLDSISVYTFQDEESAQAERESMDPDDPFPTADFIAPITLYQSGKWIVLYSGEDEAVRELLTGLLGQPFAGTLSAISVQAIPHAGGTAQP